MGKNKPSMANDKSKSHGFEKFEKKGQKSSKQKTKANASAFGERKSAPKSQRDSFLEGSKSKGGKAKPNTNHKAKPNAFKRDPLTSDKPKASHHASEKPFAYYGKKAPVCDVYERCGGCKILHMPYEEQLKAKHKWVAELLAPFGKVLPVLGMETPMHYRNKVHARFHSVKGGKVVAGMYEEGSHKVVQTKNCWLQDERANEIVRTLTKLMISFKMKAYDEDNGTGVLRHVLIRTGHVSGEVMVVLVIGSKILPAKNNFVRALLEAHPEITTVVLNHNAHSTSMVLGHQETVLYGKGFIEDTLCDTVFRISPKSFYQVNPVQTEVLYGKAIEFAGLKGDETVLDAYCGIGTIGLIASKHAKQVIGVELNRDAVRDAINNAKCNGIKNARFYEGDAGEFMRAVAEEGAQLDVVFMDPPRAGSDEAFLSSLVHLAPPKVVYVSCNPETLARDLKYLTQKGYKVEKIQPVDMFPGTGHVETVVGLYKKD